MNRKHLNINHHHLENTVVIQIPCDQMNFFGIASSGIDPSSLRKGPFSKFTFKQSLKQISALPTSAF